MTEFPMFACLPGSNAFYELLKIEEYLSRFSKELEEKKVDPEIIRDNVEYMAGGLSINQIELNEKRIKKDGKTPLKCRFCISEQNEYKNSLKRNWIIEGNKIRRKTDLEYLGSNFILKKKEIAEFVKDYENLLEFSRKISEKKGSTEIAAYNSMLDELKQKVEKEFSYSSLQQFANEIVPVLKRYKESIEASAEPELKQ